MESIWKQEIRSTKNEWGTGVPCRSHLSSINQANKEFLCITFFLLQNLITSLMPIFTTLRELENQICGCLFDWLWRKRGLCFSRVGAKLMLSFVLFLIEVINSNHIHQNCRLWYCQMFQTKPDLPSVFVFSSLFWSHTKPIESQTNASFFPWTWALDLHDMQFYPSFPTPDSVANILLWQRDTVG